MTRELADRVEMTTPGQTGRVSSKVEQLILRRQESNLRPPGYEPGELTAAPRRTSNVGEATPKGKGSVQVSSQSGQFGQRSTEMGR